MPCVQPLRTQLSKRSPGLRNLLIKTQVSCHYTLFDHTLQESELSNDECKIITIGRSIVLEAGVEDDAEAELSGAICSSKSGS